MSSSVPIYASIPERLQGYATTTPAPFDEEPGFYEPAGLWLYGNAWLLDTELVYIPSACGRIDHLPAELDQIERLAEAAVFDSRVLVCGIHSPAHQRAVIVPLRWGSPRILVLSGGFHYHLGHKLLDEPFRAARLWRYQFDARTDLVISRRAPEKLPTYSKLNLSVDSLIEGVAKRLVAGELFLRPTD